MNFMVVTSSAPTMTMTTIVVIFVAISLLRVLELRKEHTEVALLASLLDKVGSTSIVSLEPC